jgi:hypothetical protein
VNNDETRSRLSNLTNDICESLVGKCSRVLRFFLLILVVALVDFVSFSALLQEWCPKNQQDHFSNSGSSSCPNDVFSTS